ncbi:hypothetical protein M3J09_008584 [Ascochyta lentis]
MLYTRSPLLFMLVLQHAEDYEAADAPRGGCTDAVAAARDVCSDMGELAADTLLATPRPRLFEHLIRIALAADDSLLSSSLYTIHTHTPRDHVCSNRTHGRFRSCSGQPDAAPPPVPPRLHGHRPGRTGRHGRRAWRRGPGGVGAVLGRLGADDGLLRWSPAGVVGWCCLACVGAGIPPGVGS